MHILELSIFLYVLNRNIQVFFFSSHKCSIKFNIYVKYNVELDNIKKGIDIWSCNFIFLSYNCLHLTSKRAHLPSPFLNAGSLEVKMKFIFICGVMTFFPP